MRKPAALKVTEAEPQKNKRISISFFAPQSIVYVMTPHGIVERKIIKVDTESRAIITTDLDHTSTHYIYTLSDGTTRTEGEVFASVAEVKASF